MSTPHVIATHLRQVFFGGNWTWSNMKDVLSDVSWQEAGKEIDGFNSIGKLTFHIGYYVTAILNVYRGSPLESKDELSFALPQMKSEEDWKALLDKTFKEAEELAAHIEGMPESKLKETFVAEKYGSHHRNLLGLIEHTHYHLGQIVLMKKFVRRLQ